MGNPVVHFEIHGNDALQSFYTDVFGWQVQTMPMGEEGATYGLVDTDSDGHGIRGGLAMGTSGEMSVTVYIAVPDINAHLEKVEAAGGKTIQPRSEMPMVTLAIFQDPQGNTIGLVEGDGQPPEQG